jgi:hypothetical protein
MTRIGVALAAALLLAGCARAPASPRDAVDAYFRALARDPLRTLPLLTPGFHRQHGVHAVTTAEAQRAFGVEPAAPSASAAEVALDRLELGWLMVQSRGAFAKTLAGLGVEPLREERDGATAQVVVRVTPPRGGPFEQTFHLAEDERGGWRIDGVEQAGVGADNLSAAFVAHPTEAVRRRIESSLRRR